MQNRKLEPDKIIKTAEKLEARVLERFPNANLGKLAGDLTRLAADTKQRAHDLEKPIRWLQVLLFLISMFGVFTIFFVGRFITFDRIDTSAFGFAQGVEATINAVLLFGLGFVTLSTLEDRLKRAKVLKGLHDLRSLIHIIDMYQLTKDPTYLGGKHVKTQSSPERKLSPNELVRYLDYCSEMLSITGKLAALYAQAVPEATVVDAVNDVERLGTNMSSKIWQKIMIIEQALIKPATKRSIPTKRKS